MVGLTVGEDGELLGTVVGSLVGVEVGKVVGAVIVTIISNSHDSYQANGIGTSNVTMSEKARQQNMVPEVGADVEHTEGGGMERLDRYRN